MRARLAHSARDDRVTVRAPAVRRTQRGRAADHPSTKWSNATQRAISGCKARRWSMGRRSIVPGTTASPPGRNPKGLWSCDQRVVVGEAVRNMNHEPGVEAGHSRNRVRRCQEERGRGGNCCSLLLTDTRATTLKSTTASTRDSASVTSSPFTVESDFVACKETSGGPPSFATRGVVVFATLTAFFFCMWKGGQSELSTMAITI